jgi:Protein of unknown function (DUF2652)/Polyketide cyclase / dehydrase and lipid transport
MLLNAYMESKTQHGYLLLADISGYTAFIAGTELEHAHEIISELLEVILGHFMPLLTLSKLEGDAVFCYAPESVLPRGETLLEMIEATYVAFRNRRDGVRRRTTCTCNACKSIPMLDLKFIVHHGDFIRQDIAGIKELAGSDVNLIHRLLKNHVNEVTGWRAYALFTEAGLEHMGVRPAALVEQPEAYEHLGEVQTFSFDLHARYNELMEARHEFITAQQAHIAIATDIAASPTIVWEWLNDPVKILPWSPNRDMHPGIRPQGRLGPGARNHCMHGQNQTMIETILDWRPFDYFTVHQDSKLPGAFVITTQLIPIETGTRVNVHFTFVPRLGLLKPFGPQFCRLFAGMFGMVKEYAVLKRLIENPAEQPPLPALAHA